MLSQTLQDAINEQIKAELYSAYLYLGMSACCEAANLPGAAHWMRAQAQEETGHAMKMFAYVFERGGMVQLQAIEQVPVRYQSLLEVFEKTLEHERKVTGLIDDLYAQAVAEKDYATQMFLQWFVTEQVEEEATATRIVEMLRLLGDRGTGIVMLDRELGHRGR